MSRLLCSNYARVADGHLISINHYVLPELRSTLQTPFVLVVDPVLAREGTLNLLLLQRSSTESGQPSLSPSVSFCRWTLCVGTHTRQRGARHECGNDA